MNPRDPLLESPSQGHRVTRVLRERWYVVVLIAAACLIGALAISLSSPKKYQATSRLLFQQDSFGAALFGNNLFQASTDPSRVAQTNVDMVSSLQVAAAVRFALHMSESPQDLVDQMNASSQSNADIVNITITDTDPSRATRIANAWATQFVTLRQQQSRAKVGQAIADMRAKLAALPPNATTDRNEYAQQLAKLQALQAVQFGNVQLSDTAGVPSSPVSPKPTRDGIVGLVLGLALGVGVALLLDTLDRRIKSVDALEAVYEQPVIGLVPSRSFKPRTESDRRQAIEAFRAVREGLSVFAFRATSPVFLVTSAIGGEGKTTVAINLARVLAMSGDRVMLIEADLRRPSLGAHTGMRSPGDGLTTALLQDVPLVDLTVGDRTGLENLQIIPSGTPVPFAAELLRSPKMERVLEEARELSDVVIIDAPPLLPVADARSLIKSPSVDGVLLVARLYAQTSEQAKRVRALLEQPGVEEVRLIATSTPEEPAYGYDEEYAEPATPQPNPVRPAAAARPSSPSAARRPMAPSPGAPAPATVPPSPAPEGASDAARRPPAATDPRARQPFQLARTADDADREIGRDPTPPAAEPAPPTPLAVNGTVSKPRRPFSPIQG